MTAGRSPLKIGLVGCGEVSRFKHLVVLRNIPGIEVAALADIDAGRLRSVGEQFGITSRYPDIAGLLEHSPLDGIAVCVPAHSHAPVAMAVLRAGKHLFVEKPLCLSLNEADQLRNAAAASPGKVTVGFHMRFHRMIRAAHRMIRSGALGVIESIRTVWNSPRITHQNPEWRFRREHGGGVLVEIAVHCFDLWRFLLDSEVSEIYAASRHGVRDDESLAVTGKMENGMLASGLFSETTPHEIEVEICGTAGRIRLGCLRFDGFQFLAAGAAPGQPAERLRHIRDFIRELPSGLLSMRRGGDYFDSYRAQWVEFRNAIRGNGTGGATIKDGRRSLEIVLAAAESANTGLPIQISDAPSVLHPAVRTGTSAALFPA